MSLELVSQPAIPADGGSLRYQATRTGTTVMSVDMARDVALACEAVIILMTCVVASNFYAGVLALRTAYPQIYFNSEFADYTALGCIVALCYVYLSHRSKQFLPVNLLGSPVPAILDALRSWLVTMVFLVVSLYAFKWSSDYPRGWVVAWLVVGGLGLTTSRLVTVYVVRALLGRGWLRRRRVAIIGATPQAQSFACDLHDAGVSKLFDVVGVFDDAKEIAGNSEIGITASEVHGTVEDLVRLAEDLKPDLIVLALPHSENVRIHQIRYDLQAVPADIMLVPEINTTQNAPIGVTVLGRMPLYIFDRYPMQEWNTILKWIQDKMASIVLLVMLSPLLMLIILAIKLDSVGPIFFRQQRFGINNRPITVFKFRSMYWHMSDVSGARRTVRGDPRVTRVGRFLRRTSLDEVPQLINVLLGQMSLVGPRAHPVEMKVMDRYYHEVVATYAARHRVKPGLTGLAQVNGLRGEVDTLDKAFRRVELDLKYIREYSTWLDVKIIFMTVTAGLINKHAY